MKKLKESISSNSIKIIDLYNKVRTGVWDTSPDFQRKLVWKKHHKFSFIDTILCNYPFPEIYIASEKIDIERMKTQEIVVDGKQRITAIVDYIQANGDFATSKKVRPFQELETQEKKDFLNYFVTVKDLKDLELELIKEIFERINSTDYALNSNERINARFGDGEFTMFCKQIVDSTFAPSDEETDIIIDQETKKFLNNFFTTNEIFNDNDRDRMFDVQFMMVLVSTILEGEYFNRSSGINKYIEQYNSVFDIHNNVLSVILKAMKIITSLNFSPNSYWFNKANLFTLMVELSKIDKDKLDFEALESKLLDLEKKVDIYFNDDEDISLISPEERKYFEVSRQGSNGVNERKHRANVLKDVINKSQKAPRKEEKNNSNKNLDYFRSKEINFEIIKPTQTGLNKGIMDATTVIRKFLKAEEFHNYEDQLFGPDHKVIKKAKLIIADNQEIESSISMYRSNGRGDYRIWFSDLDKLANPEDEILLFINSDIIYALNITSFDYTGLFG